MDDLPDIAVTGTRRGTTKAQWTAFYHWLGSKHPFVFRHGVCVGADEETSLIARDLGNPWIIAHPPVDESRMSRISAFDFAMPALPYIERNHRMVDACSYLVALPAEMSEQLRSGTWATVRFARHRGKPVTIIDPTGGFTTYG